MYDLNKKKKEALKTKNNKSKDKKRKKAESRHANLGARIFAIFMLILMIASVLVSALAYFRY